jgi:hypothetical protein
MNTIVKPLPCFQKWEDMAPYEGGRLCGGCGKVVTDFRKKSWTEIEQTHIKSSFPVCGIYDDKQINFWGQQVLSKNNFLRSRKFFSAFFAFLYLSSPKIQLKAQPRQEIQSKQKETPSTPKPRIEKKRIIGTIVKQLNDSTKIPLENAVVYLYEDSLHKTKTDSLGRFILDISKKYNSLPKDLSLIVSHPDFPTK